MIKMLGGRVLCKEIKPKKELSEIILIGSSKEQKLHKVIVVGPDVEGLEEGFTVILPSYTTQLELDGEIYNMVAYKEIVAVVEEE